MDLEKVVLMPKQIPTQRQQPQPHSKSVTSTNALMQNLAKNMNVLIPNPAQDTDVAKITNVFIPNLVKDMVVLEIINVLIQRISKAKSTALIMIAHMANKFY
jgi:hypothetical protein